MRYGVAKIHQHKDLKVEREFQNIYNLLQNWKISGDDLDEESVSKAVYHWIDDLLRLSQRLKFFHFGQGSPNGAVAAGPGHVYLDTDGGASTTLYVKESGTGTSGWVAK